MVKDKDREDDDFSDEELGEVEEEDGPVFEEEEDASFDDEDPDDDDEDSLLPSRAARGATAKRPVARATQMVGGVPRPKLDDIKVAGEVWQRLCDDHGDADGTPYSVQGRFSMDAAVDHKAFGRGFVIGVPGGNKVEVLFQDGVRKLVQGR